MKLKRTSKKKPARRKHASPEKNNLALRTLKGAVAGLIVTVAAVLVLALIVKQTNMSDEAISAVNQVIKVASIFVAALIASRGLFERSMVAGGMAGIVYVVLGYLIFALIEGRFGDILLMFADLAMGLVIGLLTGFIFGKLLGKDKSTAPQKR